MTCPDPRKPEHQHRASRQLGTLSRWWAGIFAVWPRQAGPRRVPVLVRLGVQPALLALGAVLVLVLELWPVEIPPGAGEMPDAGVLAQHQVMEVDEPVSLPQLSDIGPTWPGATGYGRVPPKRDDAPPVDGQKRPMCLKDIEVEINGGCWWPHTAKPVNGICPDPLFEYDSRCYGVVLAKARRPTSIDGGTER